MFIVALRCQNLNTRHRLPVKTASGHGPLCRAQDQGGTRQRFVFFKFLCRVPPDLALGKDLIFFLNSLPSVLDLALGKEFFFKKNTLPSAPVTALDKGLIFFYNFFAECSCGCTRQRGNFFKKI